MGLSHKSRGGVKSILPPTAAKYFFGAPFSLILLRKISENGAPKKILFGGASCQRTVVIALLKPGPYPSHSIQAHHGIVLPALVAVVEHIVDLDERPEVFGKMIIGASVEVQQGV